MPSSSDNSTPLQAAQAFFDAVGRRDWRRAVDFISTQTLEALAEAWRLRVTARYWQPATLEQIQARDPDMPLSVAEYQLEHARRQEHRLTNWWQYELPGTTSAEDVLAASPEDLMMRYLESTRVSGEELEAIRWNILGIVMDGPDSALVVFRPDGGRRLDGDGKVRELVAMPRMLSMQRERDEWRVADPAVAALHGSAWKFSADA